MTVRLPSDPYRNHSCEFGHAASEAAGFIISTRQSYRPRAFWSTVDALPGRRQGHRLRVAPRTTEGRTRTTLQLAIDGLAPPQLLQGTRRGRLTGSGRTAPTLDGGTQRISIPHETPGLPTVTDLQSIAATVTAVVTSVYVVLTYLLLREATRARVWSAIPDLSVTAQRTDADLSIEIKASSDFWVESKAVRIGSTTDPGRTYRAGATHEILLPSSHRRPAVRRWDPRRSPRIWLHFRGVAEPSVLVYIHYMKKPNDKPRVTYRPKYSRWNRTR